MSHFLHQIGRTRAEAAHVGGQVRRLVGWRRRGILGGYSDPMHSGVNVDASGMGVHDTQDIRRRGLAQILLLTGRHSGLQS